MYERKKSMHVYFLILFIAIVCGCKTIPGTVVHDPGIGSAGVGDGIDGIAAGQTDLAITGNDLAHDSEEIGIGLGEIERAIIDGKDFSTILDKIVRSVRSRPVPDNVGL
jgi:hypothetical protein